jgi:DNA-binding MarR family transcriptional regulator
MSEERKQVLKRLIRLQRLLHRYQVQNFMSFGPWGNPQRGQGRVLSILKLKPEISQKELSYLLDMSKQALAELLEKLEKNGYIVREVSEEDRRSFNIKLTEEGAKIAGAMDDTPPELEKMLDVLSDEELRNLGDYLERMTQRLEEQSGGEDDDWRRQMAERFMEHQGRHCGGPGHRPGSPFGGGFPGFPGGKCHHGWAGGFGGID